MTSAATYPTSTYRVHLTGAFTLHQAAELVDHLDDLGIDWLYASPIQTVPAGATHGYHVLDPDSVNPELGGEDGLGILHTALRSAGRGMVLDIVPNHMAASPDNSWWADVLAHGPASPHAATFDIDFDAGPIVLPVLGETAEEAIAAGDLRVEDGQLAYHDMRLPLAPDTDLAAPIEAVLQAQHYRLHEWQSGEAQLNWRRFFAVNELAGVRVEDPAVFDAIHATLLGWVDDGIVQGLRVDHIDGLADPTAYLQRLRHAMGAGRWLVVEKILEQGEELPKEWPVQGTTGYEIGAAIQAWLTDVAGLRTLQDAFGEATGITTPVAEELPASKLAVLDQLFPGEVDRVVRELTGVPGAPEADVLRTGVRHLTAHLAGYRTYAPATGPVPPDDRAAITEAAAAAARAGHGAAEVVADLLCSDAGRPALLRWQQLTGPAAAKGFEDRLLFRHVAQAGLCEVGADAHFVDTPPSPQVVKDLLAERAATSPLAGSTTTTHDTKRSEDVRARLTVVSEDADGFIELYDRLSEGLADTSPDLDGHARWLLLQAVVGSYGWEPDDDADGTPTESYRDRLRGYAEKALREAELRTSHRQPDTGYEAGASAWLDALLSPGSALQALTTYVDRIAVAAATTSLATVLLKIAAPGVPDIYRGCEVWDGSLTDPDNRRPLDVARIRRVADAVTTAHPAEVRDAWRDGGLKLLVTRQALRARRAHPAVFCSTSCESPLVRGDWATHVAAVLRSATDTGPAGVPDPGSHPRVLALAPRLPLQLARSAGDPTGWTVGPDVWGDTAVDVQGATTATDLLTGSAVPVADGHVRMADATSILPLALLELS